MAGIYRPRHPERTVLHRVLFHHSERFVAEYESRFEREYGFFRPIVKEVVEKYLDCDHLKLRFIAEKPPLSRVFTQVALMTSVRGREYHSFARGGVILTLRGT